MLVSVVMATYNGEKYIHEQLESIYNQTEVIDELLILDDCSSDSTVNICRKFIVEHNCHNWSVYTNRTNLGFVNNFFQGIDLAKGEIILLSDQDDIWLPDRVNTIVNYMSIYPEIGSLTTTFSRCNENGDIITRHVKHPHSKKNGLAQISAAQFFKFHSYLGMSMAVRKTLIAEMPYRSINAISHDILINMFAVSKNELYHLDRVLTIRRSYQTSTSNKKINDEVKEKYYGNKKLQMLSRKIELLQQELYNIENDDFNVLMKLFLNNYHIRFNYIKNKDVAKYLKNFTNIKYYDGLTDYLGDFLYLLRMKENGK